MTMHNEPPALFWAKVRTHGENTGGRFHAWAAGQMVCRRNLKAGPTEARYRRIRQPVNACKGCTAEIDGDDWRTRTRNVACRPIGASPAG